MTILIQIGQAKNCAKSDKMAHPKAPSGAVKCHAEGRVIRVPDSSNDEKMGTRITRPSGIKPHSLPGLTDGIAFKSGGNLSRSKNSLPILKSWCNTILYDKTVFHARAAFADCGH